MILEQQEKKPFIYMEFNQTKKTVTVGTTLNVWSDVGVSATISGAEKKYENKFEINCDVVGVFEYVAKSRNSASNKLEITVI